MINIYKSGTNEVRQIIIPEDTSLQSVSIMRVNNLALNFKLAEFVAFKKGDYTKLFDIDYKLNIPPKFTKTSGRYYEFTLTLDPPVADLKKTQFLFLNSRNKYTEGKFDLHGKPIDFLNLVISNLKRKYGDIGWKAGLCIEADYQTLSYNGNNCLEVMSDLASKFSTEWICEGRTISLYKKQINSQLVFSYGSYKTLYSLTCQPQDVEDTVASANRIYAFGSDKNIGSNYRNGAQRLRLADDKLYVEKLQDGEEVVEKTVVFDGTNGTKEIYPHREGTVSSVTSPFIFIDKDIDFDITDPGYRIDGTDATVTFNTGQLSGYDFTIHNFDFATRTFTINKNTESETLEMPSDLLTPAIGDKYVVTGLLQPLKYVTQAEADLKAEAEKNLADNYADKLEFPVVCNPITFKKTGDTLKIGQLVTLDIPEMEINRQIRIISFTRKVTQPSVFQPVLADSITPEPLIIKLTKGI